VKRFEIGQVLTGPLAHVRDDFSCVVSGCELVDAKLKRAEVWCGFVAVVVADAA
jgi:hypothetical protein